MADSWGGRAEFSCHPHCKSPGCRATGYGVRSPWGRGRRGLLVLCRVPPEMGQGRWGPFHLQSHSGLALAQRWEVCAWRQNLGTEGSELCWWCPLEAAPGTTPFLERRPRPSLVLGQEAATLAGASANPQSLMWACFLEHFCALRFPCATLRDFPHSPLTIPGEGTILIYK